MIETIITVIDTETGGGVPVKANVSADARFVRIRTGEGWAVRVDREAVLLAIETEEHG